jgi:hypothetical protein
VISERSFSQRATIGTVFSVLWSIPPVAIYFGVIEALDSERPGRSFVLMFLMTCSFGSIVSLMATLTMGIPIYGLLTRIGATRLCHFAVSGLLSGVLIALILGANSIELAICFGGAAVLGSIGFWYGAEGRAVI